MLQQCYNSSSSIYIFLFFGQFIRCDYWYRNSYLEPVWSIDVPFGYLTYFVTIYIPKNHNKDVHMHVKPNHTGNQNKHLLYVIHEVVFEPWLLVAK